MEAYNSALIQDDILASLSLVIDHDYPVIPSFIHSLGTLIEAVVLHDKVYFDPLRKYGRIENTAGSIYEVIRASSFIKSLIDGGALAHFPVETDTNEHLIAKGNEYTYGHFLSDYYWQPYSFAAYHHDGERDQYIRLSFLLDNYPDIFQAENLVGGHIPDKMVEFENESAFQLVNKGVPLENILHIEGLNHRARSYINLSRGLGLNLYFFDAALPYQFGAIQSTNQKAKQLYKTIESKLDEIDEEVGQTDFQNIQIPPFCQIVLANCKDSSRAIAEEILGIRQRLRKFRQYLTNYDKAWYTAITREDRLRLKNEFNNAWKTLITAKERPSIRLIYQLWDIVKNPSGIIEKIGDKLADKGKEVSVIERVAGIHAFWNELLQAPVSDKNEKLIRKVFPNRADKPIWDAAHKFNESARGYLEKNKSQGILK